MRTSQATWLSAAALVVVFVTGVFLVFALPWRAEPVDIPLPSVDGRQVEAALAQERARSAAIGPALAQELARGVGGRYFELRALGEAMRAYGRAEAAQDPRTLEKRREVLAAVGRARAFGDNDLLALRAYQTEVFLRELRVWENRGTKSEDLVALGGSFLDLAQRHGWLRKNRWIEMGESVRSVFFRRRWNEIAGLVQAPFVLSQDEIRSLYRFLLAHPWTPEEPSAGHDERQRAVEAWRLRKVAELATIDPDYPHSLARGVILYRQGEVVLAKEAFRDHLARSPQGPNALRARNYLMATEARARAPQEP